MEKYYFCGPLEMVNQELQQNVKVDDHGIHVFDYHGAIYVSCIITRQDKDVNYVEYMFRCAGRSAAISDIDKKEIDGQRWDIRSIIPVVLLNEIKYIYLLCRPIVETSTDGTANIGTALVSVPSVASPVSVFLPEVTEPTIESAFPADVKESVVESSPELEPDAIDDGSSPQSFKRKKNR
jgi:hypothetical protein